MSSSGSKELVSADEKDADGTDERRFTVKKSVMGERILGLGRTTGMR